MTCYMMTWQGLYAPPPPQHQAQQPLVNLLVSPPVEVPTVVDRQDILNYLDKMPEVANWRASTGAIFIVTNANGMYLSTKIHEAMPRLLFAIVPIDSRQMWGWSDPDTWKFIAQASPLQGIAG
ncbi:MAG: hypothetical protein JO267_03095 [Alphaproteobacteria bacterium]|nr:hypothetical protein [Alphaproteobacteria bacterium]